ncbi:BppU family phage baseplate upper protein [Robertmurraya korlensis]|uniref:BppU family phage baseplate upper protein n=1 Tax=Robertmurraya korlensis TaxID=519977 RepID=UPI00203FC0E3|nr:BppU family phage baseplate upper protein [Robertmurraya korlensis]MCM3599407.1 BppU family phage baseplate upper protein [Robertmurraya korlensis]
MNIVQGDNKLTIPISTNMNLENATVTITVKRGGEIFTKTATILDIVTGSCEFSLTNEDLTVAGIYEYQWTAEFTDGRVKSGKKLDTYVSEKLTGTIVTVTIDGGEF